MAFVKREIKSSRLPFKAAFLCGAVLLSGLAACDRAEDPAQEKAVTQQTENFLEENAKRDGVQTTASGLQYEVISEGTGERPTASSTVVVHYTGTLTDGTKFDSSRDRGQPAQFPLNGVIRGWTEGLQLMREGGKTKFYIPSELGYGARGAPGAIPPNADLIFDVELIKIVGEPEPHPDVTAFLERPIGTFTCGDMPVPTGEESDAEVAALQEQGNAWQNCVAAFIKEETSVVTNALQRLQQIEASQVPSQQQMDVNTYLQKFSETMDDAQTKLNAYKGISKS